MNRLHYLFSTVVIFVAIAVSSWLLSLSNPFVLLLGVFLMLFTLYLMLLFFVRRLHDAGISGWFSFPYFMLSYVASAFTENQTLLGAHDINLRVSYFIVVISAAAVSFAIVFCPGQKFENKYGSYIPRPIFGHRKKAED